jgi:predicted amidophosphoribosyltransferase
MGTLRAMPGFVVEEQRTCPNCGEPVADSDAVCPHCGEPLVRA